MPPRNDEPAPRPHEEEHSNPHVDEERAARNVRPPTEPPSESPTDEGRAPKE